MAKSITIHLPFPTESFKQVWEDWVKYRSEKKLKPYAPTGLKRTFNQLVKWSNNNEELAVKMLEVAMQNNWQGFFELREEKTVDQRKREFYIKLTKYRDKNSGLYPAQMYKEFFTYWTKVDDLNDSKMAFDKVIIFNFDERLKGWHEKTDKEKLSQMWKEEPVTNKAKILNLFKS